MFEALNWYHDRYDMIYFCKIVRFVAWTLTQVTEPRIKTGKLETHVTRLISKCLTDSLLICNYLIKLFLLILVTVQANKN